jgi:hypothetical protein
MIKNYLSGEILLDETLRENLGLPVIGGEIIAFFYRDDYEDILSNLYTSSRNFVRVSSESNKTALDTAIDDLRKRFPDKSDEIVRKVRDLAAEKELREFDFFVLIEINLFLDQIYASNLRMLFVTDWKLHFQFAGPDRRHLDGSASVTPNLVGNLVSDLELCYQKMLILQQTSFEGKFSKIIRNGNPLLEIYSEHGRTWLRFWVQSKNFKYFNSIDSNDLERIIGKLCTIDGEAKKLTSTLESLCF